MKETKSHELYDIMLRDKHLFPVIAYGCAGTGKTYGAVGAAVEWLERHKGNKVLVTRPNVSFAKELGYLPGDAMDKLMPWVAPVRQNFKLHGLCESKQEEHEKKGRIEYIALEHIQGLTFDNTFIIVDECFTGDTEVLTEEGFIRFDELGDQKVGQVVDGKVEFVVPERKIQKHYKGNMATVSTGRFSLTTTENHDLVYRTPKGEMIKQKAGVKPKTNLSKITSVKGGTGGSLLSFDELNFAVAMQADGCLSHTVSSSGKKHYYWEAAFSKEDKVNRLKSILDNLGVEYSIYDKNSQGKVKFYIPHPELHSNFLTDTKEFKVKELLKLTKAGMERFINEVTKWDGSLKGTPLYCSTSLHNIKVVQTIAHLVGFRARVMESEDTRKDTFSKYYRLTLVDTDKITLQKAEHTLEPYEGEVYCCTVPSGMIMVRQKGSIVVTGNCQNMTFDQLKVFLTRVGKWSKVVLCGDIAQISPKFRGSGLAELINMIKHFDMNVHTIEFTKDDILRSEQCKAWICAFDDWEGINGRE